MPDTLKAVPAGIRTSRVNASDEAEMDAFFKEVSAVWSGVDVVCANDRSLSVMHIDLENICQTNCEHR